MSSKSCESKLMKLRNRTILKSLWLNLNWLNPKSRSVCIAAKLIGKEFSRYIYGTQRMSRIRTDIWTQLATRKLRKFTSELKRLSRNLRRLGDGI